MANHVQNYITVLGNEAVMQKFADQVANKREEVTMTNWEGNPMTVEEHVSIEQLSFMPKYDEDKSWDWYRDNVGAKWAHIDDGADDYINIVSAWSPVSEFCMKLVEFLSLTDPNVLLRHQYEDEFRNFMGKQYYGSDKEQDESINGWYAWEGDYYETDGDELVQEFNERFPDIDTTAEDFDWYDEVKTGGDVIYPNEVLDEIADNFWSKC